ncbi:MAG: zinc-binding dehydrogenase [Candidatus Marinimicrobia bacterium]|nr:zinc-binding dehydrogenase [Candidatus Neomarinimicrobiota bacterium]
MKAVQIESHGGVDVLEIADIPTPVITPDKVLVKVEASSINHLDIWVRKGFPGITLPMPLILGSDAAGIVVESGKNVPKYTSGDEVIIQPGTYCGNCKYCDSQRENYCQSYGVLGETQNGVQGEYILLHPDNLHPKPKALSFTEAASMPLIFMTAHQMLVRRAELTRNDIILIYGGTSGVGGAAIQIAKDIGAEIIATVGSDEKMEFAYAMGANIVINHSHADWYKEVKSHIGKNAVDVIFEHIGSATWEHSLRLLAKGGRIVTCGATTGNEVSLNLTHLFIKQHSVLGSTMSDILTFKSVMEKISNGIYTPFVDKVFSADEIQEAHVYIEERKHMGKVVVEFGAS